MDAIAQIFIDWIERHQAWLPLIMLIFAATETTAFLSLLIPSTAVLMAVGAMVATGKVAFWPLWAGAAAGALIGSTFSYWLGRAYGRSMLERWPLSDHPQMVEKARAAFVKYGPASLLIGHFMTVLRPVVFLLAGMTSMRLRRFMAWNLLGCVTWAYLVPKLGEFGGDIFGWLWALFV
ncbi:DedA family protein [Xinfangfangia sp. CPCC 101601]|uniref:DedA family protein n=1 Tax=Pseudogemmobacter lacusdianii TaxID=3069608 RepID=A0ABU0VYH0_9RHOB|nr:DedA family protein [Xinfangfangia sp. CPCC 101601]MDQ2066783.1 DedA family protein [Xinfangfangia sp. CPCC 101601]